MTHVELIYQHNEKAESLVDSQSHLDEYACLPFYLKACERTIDVGYHSIILPEDLAWSLYLSSNEYGK